MISLSIFRNIYAYMRSLYWGFRSLLESSLVVVPYLFGWGEHRKEVTEQYPDPVSSRTEDDLPVKSRGMLFNDVDACTGCGDCSAVCPANCIRIEVQDQPATGKKWVAVYDIDYGRCILCGLCVEVCEPASLKHTKRYEGAHYQREHLFSQFGRGWVSKEQREKWERMRPMEEVE